MESNKKVLKLTTLGFTLVELLAVIVILAIILAIAVPSISGMISGSTRGAFESDAKMVLKQLEYKKLEDDTFDETTITESNIKSLLGISDSNYEVLQIKIESGKPYIIIIGKGKWEGYKACGTIKNIKVVDATNEEECMIPPLYTDFDPDEGVNKPKLIEGMTAIKWEGNDWVKVDDPDNDTSWYDYANQEWANAVTGDCETPGDYDTCSMWVWIPRYAYQITKCYSQGPSTCINPITNNQAGEIDVKFLIDDTNTTSDSTTIYEDNATDTHYVLHPAFIFGDKQLTGIWVAKFEMSGEEATLASKPNVIARLSLKVGTMFTWTRNMEKNANYGWTPIPSGATLGSNGIFSTESGANPDYNGIDTHMMKNIEWGAVAYLSQSTFGKNAEITINSDSNYYTGGGSGTAYVTNVAQSTTGNIYGIYDISGGANEYVMGNYNNTAGSSGLTPSSINDKYIDRYPATAYTASIYGDAVYETSSSSSGSTSWYSDYSYMPDASGPWFIRGGFYYYGSNAGAFFFNVSGGGANSNYSWRSVVLVGAGL